MIKKLVIGLIGCYFFVFLVNNLQLTFDRYSTQLLFLSILNLISFSIALNKVSLIKVVTDIRKEKLILFYSAFMILSGISIVVASNKSESLVVYSQYLTFLFAFLSIFILCKYFKINLITLTINFCIISVLIESTYILYQLIDNVIVNDNIFKRGNAFRGFTANINIAAFSIAAKSQVIIYKIFTSKSSKNIFFYSIILFIAVSCLFILLSRGGFMAFFFGTFCMFIYSFLFKVDKKFKSSIIVIITILVSYFSISSIVNSDSKNIIGDRISAIQIDENDQSINERLRFYSAALTSIKNKPILGIGVGNWKIESIKYDAKYLTGYRIPLHAHNDFLQVGAESGLIALMFFISFLFYPFYSFLKKGLYKKLDMKFFVFLVMLSIYIIDSLLNFPLARPVSHLLLLFIVSSLIFKINELENITN